MEQNKYPSVLLASALIFSLPSACCCQDDRLSLDYLKGYVFDTGRIVSSPARWEGRDWAKTGMVVGIAAGLYGADAGIQDMARRNRRTSGRHAANLAENFGNGAVVAPALGAVCLFGHLTDEPKARRTGLYGLESLVVSGLFVHAAKQAAHRHRPYTGRGRSAWDGPGFSFDADTLSFPSGHSAAAFSWATVAASEYGDHPWFPPLAYGVASATALSRVYQDKHWASDVFFGSALGYFTARFIIRYHEGDRSVTLLPFLNGQRAGLTGLYRFG